MNKRIPIAIGFLFLAFFVWLSLTPNAPVRYVISRIDNIFYDIQLRLHVWTHPYASESTVAIVDVDDESLKAIGRWPWPRSLLAKLVDQLKQHGAVVVATDMMFSEPDENVVGSILTDLNAKKLITPELSSALAAVSPDFEQDGIFARSLQNTDTVLGMVLLPRNQQQGILSPPLLQLTWIYQQYSRLRKRRQKRRLFKCLSRYRWHYPPRARHYALSKQCVSFACP
jgi:adenylate cyclase